MLSVYLQKEGVEGFFFLCNLLSFYLCENSISPLQRKPVSLPELLMELANEVGHHAMRTAT